MNIEIFSQVNLGVSESRRISDYAEIQSRLVWYFSSILLFIGYIQHYISVDFSVPNLESTLSKLKLCLQKDHLSESNRKNKKKFQSSKDQFKPLTGPVGHFPVFYGHLFGMFSKKMDWKDNR